MNIVATFLPVDPSVIGFRQVLAPLRPIIQQLQAGPLGQEWFLTGNDEKSSYLYTAFTESGELTMAAEAVLETAYKGKQVRTLSTWNGKMERHKGASLALSFHQGSDMAWFFEVGYPDGEIQAHGPAPIIDLVQNIARVLRPTAITVQPPLYSAAAVFQDKPGAGWMLYLPRTIAVSQAPEAQQVVSVMDDNKVQIGTVIVSVAGVFNRKDHEHVKAANRIEIRLADQDLLPLLVDL